MANNSQKPRDGFQPGPEQATGPVRDITDIVDDLAEQNADAGNGQAAEVTPSVMEELAHLREENERLRRINHGSGGRFLVAEVFLHPTRKTKLDCYAVDIVADVPAARDKAHKMLHDPKMSPFGGRMRVVEDTKEQADLVAILPRNWPDFQLERQARAASMQDAAALEETLAKAQERQTRGAW